jgi:predicted transcriptional regulator
MFGEGKRTFKELQLLILKAIKTKKLTKNQISRKMNIRWEVVDHQLILLKGQDYAKIFFEHEKMKIYTITKLGLKYLKKMTR